MSTPAISGISLTGFGIASEQRRFGTPSVYSTSQVPELHSQVESHLPPFIQEDHRAFVQFIREYYKFSERGEGPLYYLRRLLQIQNIDTTTTELIEYFFREYAPNFPRNTALTPASIIKNIKQFYLAKGSEKSFAFLFRVFFDAEIEFYYPRLDILKFSHGKWIQNTSIRTILLSGVTTNLPGSRIIGTTSKNSAFVENVAIVQEGPLTVHELFLNYSSIIGKFSLNEEIVTENNDVRLRILPMVSRIAVVNPGSGYTVGQEVIIQGNGFNCKAKVKKVGESGEVQVVEIYQFGAGYTPGETIAVFPSTEDQATGQVEFSAVIKYPGFFLNSDGMLSSLKYLQDSYYYQQFSYVIKAPESRNQYEKVVKNLVHPAGLIFFSQVVLDAFLDATITIPPDLDGLITTNTEIFADLRLDYNEFDKPIPEYVFVEAPAEVEEEHTDIFVEDVDYASTNEPLGPNWNDWDKWKADYPPTPVFGKPADAVDQPTYIKTTDPVTGEIIIEVVAPGYYDVAANTPIKAFADVKLDDIVNRPLQQIDHLPETFVSAGEPATTLFVSPSSIFSAQTFGPLAVILTSGNQLISPNSISSFQMFDWPTLLVAANNESAPVTIISAANTSLAITETNRLYAWGDNEYAQLGKGNTSEFTLPVLIGDGLTWKYVAAGTWNSAGIKSDDSVWVSDANPKKILDTPSKKLAFAGDTLIILTNDGNIVGWNHNLPRFADGDWSDIDGAYTFISPGDGGHFLALKSNGTLWNWGYADDRISNPGNGPSQVGTDSDWIAISAGGSHSMALKSNGTLWAWGWNNYGQLGDGTVTNKLYPVQIGTDNDWIKVQAGTWHTVALKSDGTMWIWGLNASDWASAGMLDGGTTRLITKPERLGADDDWIEIAAGPGSTYAIKRDTTLWAWGFQTDNQAFNIGDGKIQPTPDGGRGYWGNSSRSRPAQISPETGWASIQTSDWNTVFAIKEDGTLWAWGVDTAQGKLFTGSGNFSLIGTEIATPTSASIYDNIRYISSGLNHTLAVKSIGRQLLLSWGRNNYGQLGDGTTIDRTSPVYIGAYMGKVAASNCHSVGILSWDLPDGYYVGRIRLWGNNSNGQLGDGTYENKLSPIGIALDAGLFPWSGNRWKEVAAGGYEDETTQPSYGHTLAIQENGTLWYAGWQPGDGASEGTNVFVQVGSDSDWKLISTGSMHHMALKEDGSLWVWGSNEYGQLGDSSLNQYHGSNPLPVQLGLQNDWSTISCGWFHSLAIKNDGTLWAWGKNTYGQLGDGTTINKEMPIQIGTDTDWVSVVGGVDHTIATKRDGSVWGWGRNHKNQLGNNTGIDLSVPTRIIIPEPKYTGPIEPLSINSQEFVPMIRKSLNPLWGRGTDDTSTVFNRNVKLKITTIVEKTVFRWGNTFQPTPTQIPSESPCVFAAGTQNDFDIGGNRRFGRHFIIKEDGTLWAQGTNILGALGDGTGLDKDILSQIGTDDDWVKVWANSSCAIAQKTDGTIWGWGQNNLGQLGIGYKIAQIGSPIQIGIDSDWAKISIGHDHTLALKIDGTLWAWGQNSYAHLGDGTGFERLLPIQIGTNSDWIDIAAGNFFSVGLTSDGSLWTWGGGNSRGEQPGRPASTFEQISQPGKIPAGEDWSGNTWISIAAAGGNVFGIKDNNSLWAWGTNSSGELGDGTTTMRYRPRPVGQDKDWIKVAPSGWGHTLALKSNGTLWAWGRNDYGQLGLGNYDANLAPIQVGTDNDWSDIYVGGLMSLAFKSTRALESPRINYQDVIIDNGINDGGIGEPIVTGMPL